MLPITSHLTPSSLPAIPFRPPTPPHPSHDTPTTLTTSTPFFQTMKLASVLAVAIVGLASLVGLVAADDTCPDPETQLLNNWWLVPPSTPSNGQKACNPSTGQIPDGCTNCFGLPGDTSDSTNNCCADDIVGSTPHGICTTSAANNCPGGSAGGKDFKNTHGDELVCAGTTGMKQWGTVACTASICPTELQPLVGNFCYRDGNSPANFKW